MANVMIYTTPSCIYCKAAKAFLSENNIKYKEKDLSKDIPARDEMFDKSNQMGVPVIDVDGKIVIGFDKSELSKLFNIK